VLTAYWPPRAPLAAWTVAASMSLSVPIAASANGSDPAASSTQVNINSPGANPVGVNQPAVSDAAANSSAAAAAAINPTDPNPPNIPGQVILGDGFVYQGSLRDGMPDGKGVKRWPTGDWVAGDFVQGMLDGNAVVHHSDGGTLTGTFRHNAPWDAVEKDANGNAIAMYQGGVMRAVTQTAAPAVQQVRSRTPASGK
jgi:hypothetical protein